MADVPNVALRVSQLDAAELDSEIVSLTKTQLVKLFQYQESNFLSNFEPEISAGIKLLLWKFSVSASDSTLGQAMLSLKYRNMRAPSASEPWITHRQKLLYACLLIGCPWLKDRSHDLLKILRLEDWDEKMQQIVLWLETAFKVATLANFLVFLRQGSYLYLLERLLGIRAVFPEKQGIRQVTFEFMTRELLWHGFSEFLFFVLPLINYQRIKNFLAKKLKRSPAAPGHSSQPALQRDLTSCAVCSHWPIRAQHIGCPHVFCYFCIQSNYKADPAFCCPLCGRNVGDISNIQTVIAQQYYNSDDEDMGS